MTKIKVLVVDDEPDIRNLISEILEDEGFQVEVADGGESAKESLKHHRPDIMLLDIWMPGIDGVSMLKEWAEEGGLPCPIIMMSGHGTVETAVEATRLGAYDFIEKPLSIAKLLLTIERALETEKLHRENTDLKQMLIPLDEPIGKSKIMLELKQQIKLIANHDTWVLITGEAGTGKMSFARYLHNLSSRKDAPFIEIAAGSIAKENSMTELFGSEKSDKIVFGKLEQANNGTLFIDEVADLDMQTQVRLLSALQSGKITRVSGSEEIQVNVRVVAATRLDLQQEVVKGNFREDLYYQLNVVPIQIPPLRDHSEDVHELLDYYVDLFVRRDSLKYRRFNVAAQNRLRMHGWPGNIRELKNMVQRLLILGREEEVSLQEIETVLGSFDAVSESKSKDNGSYLGMTLKDAKEQFEKNFLEKQLEVNGGNVGEMAKKIGIDRTNLYRKLKSHDIATK
ncbi:MAG: sigma-54-dependent Fis family transcriptional regulator [Gammaproteobacteria bacterium]|nr:MAG: sigma-54-dependent Fis family transcriptional regulator [Gammaproteobacteria bacterium]